MDFSNITKYADYDVYNLSRARTAVKNEKKNKTQAADIVLSDYFKTLREPIIEQQKKTDEKQDKLNG